jgi:hypothetical protein
MNETNQTSYAEIQRILAPKIEALTRQTTYPEYEESSLPPIRYREVVGEKGFQTASPPVRPAARQSKFQRVQLLDESVQLLRDIAAFPADGLKRRYDRLLWGIQKGNDRLGELKAAGLILINEVPSTSPKGGRARLVASLTALGSEFLEAVHNQQQPERSSDLKSAQQQDC